ncbi:PP2C family protein-serine/threonine phosphatase [Rubrivirga sp.]|uniref:PP2C family protein-serine/threonine phosphatase n=1 Tax=Rubrivirga sp. TaxID=1885344 RepID=UPI003C75A018
MAGPVPLGAVDDPVDATIALDDPLDALALALMSRLLTSRAAVALVEDDRQIVSVTKGATGLEVGADAGPTGSQSILEGAGLSFFVPLQHGGEAVGVLALGARMSGSAYTSADAGIARALANAATASFVAQRSASDLLQANRSLASRAHELRTLFELAQAFGRSLDKDAVAQKLAFALMGQLMVRRVAVALCDSDDGPLETVISHGADLEVVPRDLARLSRPAPVGPDLEAEGWSLAVPIRAGDVSRGVAVLGPSASGPIPASALDFAAALAAVAVGGLESADRVSERLERERLREEVRLAREVQARLLPTDVPRVPGLEVAARWRPSHDVSGDTYDAVDLGRGRVLVAVADVVGKGIGASLLMATLQAGFKMVQPDLAKAIDLEAALCDATVRLDRLVSESTEPHQFVTLAWAVLEAGGAVTSVVAGHPSPRVVRGDGSVHGLEVGGPLLGVLPSPTFRASRSVLEVGDALVLYSDGATEAQNAAGDELGVEGVDAVLASCDLEVDALVGAVIEAVDAWDAGGNDDDLTLVAVRRVGLDGE